MFWNLSPWLPHPHAYLPFWLGPEPGTGDLSLPYCGRTSLKLRACRVCIPIPRSPHGASPIAHLPEIPFGPQLPRWTSQKEHGAGTRLRRTYAR